jgi:hypothetical protein
MMKLYITPGSPYARIARIIVLEKGLEARNPTFLWRAQDPKLSACFDWIAARPSFVATAPPSA